MLGESIMTIKDGAVITIGANATKSQRYAAQLLQKYIAKSIDLTFDIVSDEKQYESEIVVGKTNREKQDLFDYGYFEEEGYQIAALEGKLYITGGGSRGVIYGVLQFLEDFMGCRFFTKDCEKIVKSDSIKIPDNLNIRYKPHFKMRDLMYACELETDISVKHRINRSHFSIRYLPEEVGGSKKFAGYFAHTLGEYAETGYSAPMPCLCDQNVFDTVMKNVYSRLSDSPDADYVCIAANDDYLYCKCEKCNAVFKDEGSQMGVMLKFVNRAAEMLEKDYPNVLVVTYAYQHTRRLPKHERPRHNVGVVVCSIEACFKHPLDECDSSAPSKWMEIEEGMNFKNDLIEWSKVCQNVFVWDYAVNFHHYTTPFPNYKVLQSNIAFFATSGVSGLFEQCKSNIERHMGYGDFDEFKAYILSKLMFKPFMDYGEFVKHCFEFLEYFLHVCLLSEILL